MKKKFFIFLSILWVNYSYSQTFTQTFIDRCTGEVQIVTANFNTGTAVVAFYDEAKLFTYKQYINGDLQRWLQQKYTWWATLSPCSSATAQTQNAQNIANNATNNPNISSKPPPENNTPPTDNSDIGETPTTSDNTDTNQNNPNGEENLVESTGEESNNGIPEEGSGESGGETPNEVDTEEPDVSENNEPGENEVKETEDIQEEETEIKEEDIQEEETEIKEEETQEEETETKEEETKEEEQEEEKETEEEQEEETETEEEKEEETETEEESKEEEKKFMPIQLKADMLQQQALTLNYNTIISVGASQSSIYGDRTNTASLMIYDNLKQIGLNIGTSKISLTDNYQVSWVDGISLSYMKNYNVNTVGISLTRTKPLGKYGSIGLGINYSTMFGEDQLGEQLPNIYSLGYNFLYTNPIKINPRIIYSPAIIASQTPMSYVDETDDSLAFGAVSKDFIGILANSFMVRLTKSFSFNLGWTIIYSSNEFVPIMNSFMIGSKIPI